MKLQFDANQEYQKKAGKSAVDLFKGQANLGNPHRAGWGLMWSPWYGDVG